MVPFEDEILVSQKKEGEKYQSKLKEKKMDPILSLFFTFCNDEKVAGGDAKLVEEDLVVVADIGDIESGRMRQERVVVCLNDLLIGRDGCRDRDDTAARLSGEGGRVADVKVDLILGFEAVESFGGGEDEAA